MSPKNHVAGRLPLLCAVLLAAGCDTRAPTDTGWSDPIPPKQNQVTFVTVDHDVRFVRGAKAVSADEAASLSNFVRNNGVGEGDTVIVDGSDGSSNLAAARQAAVLAELKALHVHAAAASSGIASRDTVRVHVGHAVVTAPRCPDWSKPEPDNPTNSPSSNYGCATEANLAAMIANPADLVRGRESNVADGGAMARAVELYKSGGLTKTLSGSSGYSSAGLSGPSGPAASGGGGGQ